MIADEMAYWFRHDMLRISAFTEICQVSGKQALTQSPVDSFQGLLQVLHGCREGEPDIAFRAKRGTRHNRYPFFQQVFAENDIAAAF